MGYVPGVTSERWSQGGEAADRALDQTRQDRRAVTAACADEARPNSGLTDDRDDASVTTEANTIDPPTTAATTMTTFHRRRPDRAGGRLGHTYVVPDQFAPGTYRVDGYWARLDADQNIIDNDIVDAPRTAARVLDVWWRSARPLVARSLGSGDEGVRLSQPPAPDATSRAGGIALPPPFTRLDRPRR